MFFKRDLVLGQEYLAFLLLNLFDLFLTGWFLHNRAYEANGLAAFILKHYGLRDFALFKFIMVIFLIIVCEIIAMANVKRARFVILLGCAVYLLLVLWESFLLITQAPVIHQPDSIVPVVARLGDGSGASPAARWQYASLTPVSPALAERISRLQALRNA